MAEGSPLLGISPSPLGGPPSAKWTDPPQLPVPLSYREFERSESPLMTTDTCVAGEIVPLNRNHRFSEFSAQLSQPPAPTAPQRRPARRSRP